jgi:hypothetical protein
VEDTAVESVILKFIWISLGKCYQWHVCALASEMLHAFPGITRTLLFVACGCLHSLDSFHLQVMTDSVVFCLDSASTTSWQNLLGEDWLPRSARKRKTHSTTTV